MEETKMSDGISDETRKRIEERLASWTEADSQKIRDKVANDPWLRQQRALLDASERLTAKDFSFTIGPAPFQGEALSPGEDPDY